MRDLRLDDYLIEKGYIKDYTSGGIIPGHIDPNKKLPLLINDKCVLGDCLSVPGLTLEEFKEWEVTQSYEK